MADWHYDDLRQVGVDFEDAAAVSSTNWPSALITSPSISAADFATYVRDEQSTYDWVLEGLIERAGFRIDRKMRWDAIYTDYLCTNTAERSAI